MRPNQKHLIDQLAIIGKPRDETAYAMANDDARDS